MAVDDLWYLRTRDHNGDRIPSKRHGRGKRYRVRWEDPETGAPRTQLFTKKSDAERHDANVRADISRGVYIDPAAGQITVRDYSEQWRAQQMHADSTQALVEKAFRVHVWPHLGDKPLSSIRRGHLQSWVKDRSAPGVLAPSTVTLVFGYLASMFKAAVLDKAIGVSPCVGVKLPPIPDSDRYIPTPREIHAVAEALPPYYRAAPFVAAGCGLRPQEVFGLELGHIDWLRRELSVRQQMRQPEGGAPAYLGTLKTRTSRRIVEVPTATLEALARHLEIKPPQTVRMLDRTNPRAPVVRDTTLLFTTSFGRPLNRSGWSTTWRRALRRAGVTEGWGMHALRHFFATSLIHGGASVKTVQLALGHSKPSITLDTYTHEWPDAEERTRTVMEAALSIDVGEAGSVSAR